MAEMGHELPKRYNHFEYVDWVTRQDGWLERAKRLQDLGRASRRAGPIWREADLLALQSAGARRAEDDYLTGMRALGSVLPPAWRPFVRVLVEGAAPPIRGWPSRSLQRWRFTRLQRLCLLRLGGRPLPDCWRRWFGRELQHLNPSIPPSLTMPLRDHPAASGFAPRIGETIHYHATAAAAGYWIPGASHAGWPAAGKAIDADGHAVTVQPPPLPPRRPSSVKFMKASDV